MSIPTRHNFARASVLYHKMRRAGEGSQGGPGATLWSLRNSSANVNIRPRRGVWGNRVAPCPHPVGGFGRATPSQEVCSSRRGAARAAWRAEEISAIRPLPGGSRRGLVKAKRTCAGKRRPCGCAAPRRDEDEGSSWEGAARAMGTLQNNVAFCARY